MKSVVCFFLLLAVAHASMTCRKADHFTVSKTVIFVDPYEICKFSDGAVHTSMKIGDYYESKDFTPAQWKAEVGRQSRIEKQLLQEETTCRLYIREGNKPPSNLNCQRPLDEWSQTPGPQLKEVTK